MIGSRFTRMLQVVLAAAVAGCSGPAPVDEVAELATMGSQRPLRQPMNPVRGGSRVLMFALDGVGYDDLVLALRSGAMPKLSSVLGDADEDGAFANAHLARMLAIFPSSTAPAWASVFTGAPPSVNGIAGNEWFDRERTAFYAPVPLSVSERSHSLQQYTDELISDLLRTRTVFEEMDVRVHVSMQPVFRGADLLTVPNAASFGRLFQSAVEEAIETGTPRGQTLYRETDLSSIEALLEAVEGEEIPDLQIAYLPGSDMYTHEAEAPLSSLHRYLSEVTDSAIGRVLDLYRERGVLDRTFVLVVGDHGHTPVIKDDRRSLHLGDGEPTELVERLGYRLRPPSLSNDPGDYQVVLAYQGAVAYVYVADRSTCPRAGDVCQWSRPPRTAEDVLPLVRGFREAARTGALVPALRGAIDLVLVRDSDPAGGGYLVYEDGALTPVADYLERVDRPELVALERRLEWLGGGPHGHLAGDIVLTTRYGTDVPIEERFYFGPPYWSEHGSAHPRDSWTPLVLAHPGRAAGELAAIVREVTGGEATQLHIAALLRRLLQEDTRETGPGPRP